MKILVLLGSPRKGNTYPAAERIRKTMQEKALVEWWYVMLRDLCLEPCRGCGTCFVRVEDFCPIHDDIGDVVEKMEDADGVIFATFISSVLVGNVWNVGRHSRNLKDEGEQYLVDDQRPCRNVQFIVWELWKTCDWQTYL
jgi:hypothetical protein